MLSSLRWRMKLKKKKRIKNLFIIFLWVAAQYKKDKIELVPNVINRGRIQQNIELMIFKMRRVDNRLKMMNAQLFT